jgi:anti-anti-sigma factor
MRITSINAGATEILNLSGKFDFNDLKIFKAAYEATLNRSEVTALNIDMSELNYIDSTALGMLMLLRQRAGAVGKKVILKHPNQEVREVLDIGNLGSLFAIV